MLFPVQFGNRTAYCGFVAVSIATLGDSTQIVGEIPQGRVKRHIGLLLPREHGAYAQLGFPMAAAWLLVRPGWNAGLWTLACFLAFWAHEPLLILAGRRGKARLLRHGRRALALTAILLPVAMAGVVAAVLLPPRLPWTAFLPALVLGAASSGLAIAGRERSLAGELTAGLALVWAALPVAVAGAATPVPGLELVLLWSLIMAAAMLAVRGIIARAKRGSRASAFAAVQLALAGLAPALAFAVGGLLPLRFALALVPVAAVTLVWLNRPPAPRALRSAGVALVVANLAALALLLI